VSDESAKNPPTSEKPGSEKPAWMYVVAWFVAGFSMVLFNKQILSNSEFFYPFFLTSCHNLFGTIAFRILYYTNPDLFPAVRDNAVTMGMIKRYLLPVTLLFAVALVAGNAAYNYISLAYIQMLKSITPVPIFIVACLTGRETPTTFQFALVVVICLGVFVASVGELKFTWIGFGLQTGAMLCDVGRITLTDQIFFQTKLDPLSVVFYNSPLAFIWLGLGFLVFESHRMDVSKLTPSFCAVLLANALMAVFVNLSGIFLIKRTSAMVIALAGLLKDIILVVSSWAIFGAPISQMQMIGYTITVAGLMVYKEYKRNPATVMNQLNGLRVALSTCNASEMCVLCMPNRAANISSGKSEDGSNVSLITEKDTGKSDV
jgi:drug/metabolite transporter (DMT)-like permease